MKRGIGVLALSALAIAGCSSVTGLRIDACKDIKDEALRVQCLKDIPEPTTTTEAP